MEGVGMIGIVVSAIVTLIGIYLCLNYDGIEWLLGNFLAFIGGAIFAYSLKILFV